MQVSKINSQPNFGMAVKKSVSQHLIRLAPEDDKLYYLRQLNGFVGKALDYTKLHLDIVKVDGSETGTIIVKAEDNTPISDTFRQFNEEEYPLDHLQEQLEVLGRLDRKATTAELIEELIMMKSV